MSHPPLIPVRPRGGDIPLVAVRTAHLTNDFDRLCDILEEYFDTDHLAFGEPSDAFVFCCRLTGAVKNSDRPLARLRDSTGSGGEIATDLRSREYRPRTAQK